MSEGEQLYEIFHFKIKLLNKKKEKQLNITVCTYI